MVNQADDVAGIVISFENIIFLPVYDTLHLLNKNFYQGLRLLALPTWLICRSSGGEKVCLKWTTSLLGVSSCLMIPTPKPDAMPGFVKNEWGWAESSIWWNRFATYTLSSAHLVMKIKVDEITNENTRNI